MTGNCRCGCPLLKHIVIQKKREKSKNMYAFELQQLDIKKRTLTYMKHLHVKGIQIFTLCCATIWGSQKHSKLKIRIMGIMFQAIIFEHSHLNVINIVSIC